MKVSTRAWILVCLLWVVGLLNYLEAAYPPRAPARGGWQNPFSK
jgi:hypothetical protein